MENRTNKLVMIAVCCIAAALVIGLAIASVSNAKTKLAEQNRLAANTDECAEYWEEEERFFSTIEEYEAFLLQQEVESGRCSSIEDAEVVYYAPATLPEDVSLIGITVSAFTTTFDYSVDRSLRDIGIDLDNDEALAEVFSNMRLSFYTGEYSKFNDFVSDFREFGENLATCLSTPLSTSSPVQDRYVGDVYCDVTNNGVTQSICVGWQIVDWRLFTDPNTNETEEQLIYWYMPLGLTQLERDNDIQIVAYIVNGNDLEF